MTTKPQENDLKSQRAKGRWAILRNALLSKHKANSNVNLNNNGLEDNNNNKICDNSEKNTSQSSSVSSVSIHRFSGFNLLGRTDVSESDDGESESQFQAEKSQKNQENNYYEKRLSTIYLPSNLIFELNNTLKKNPPSIDEALMTNKEESSSLIWEKLEDKILLHAFTLDCYNKSKNKNKEDKEYYQREKTLTLVACCSRKSKSCCVDRDPTVEESCIESFFHNLMMHYKSSVDRRNSIFRNISKYYEKWSFGEPEFSYLSSSNNNKVTMSIFLRKPKSSNEPWDGHLLESFFRMYRCVDYYTTRNIDKETVKIRVLEKGVVSGNNTQIRKNNDILKQLTSERHYGVDNTSNTRIWDSESTLAYCILAQSSSSSVSGDQSNGRTLNNNLHGILSIPPQQDEFKEGDDHETLLRVVELGSGMAGLSGLLIGAMEKKCRRRTNVVLTDGHPQAVYTNRVSSLLTQCLFLDDDNYDQNQNINGFDENNIHCQRLLWDCSGKGHQECQDLKEKYNNSHDFHLCLVSDCLHFQNYHADLIVTIARLLCVGGKCLLCQPPRGKSMQNFIDIVKTMNVLLLQNDDDNNGDTNSNSIFKVDYTTDYNDTLSSLHKNHLDESRSRISSKNIVYYDPNIHYPHLIILTKLRELDEGTDMKFLLQATEEVHSTK